MAKQDWKYAKVLEISAKGTVLIQPLTRRVYGKDPYWTSLFYFDTLPEVGKVVRKESSNWTAYFYTISLAEVVTLTRKGLIR